MIKFSIFAILGAAFTLITLAAGNQSGQRSHDGGFFNPPLYQLPEFTSNKTCILDVALAPIEKEQFVAMLDRILEETRYDIVHSNPLRRDRVIYAAPENCIIIEKDGAFSPHRYFGGSVSSFKTGPYKHPWSLNDKPIPAKFKADLKNAAFAAELKFSPTGNLAEAKKQNIDHSCLVNSNIRDQIRYGLPILFISVRDDAIIYTYNIRPSDSDLVDFLLDRAFAACGINYEYDIRALSTEEADELSINFTPYP